MLGGSAAADGVDDFHFVAFAQGVSLMLAARHDFLIHFDRHASSGIASFVQQLDEGEVIAAVVRMAVEGDLHLAIVAAGSCAWPAF
jgi:hypothetical protein